MTSTRIKRSFFLLFGSLLLGLVFNIETVTAQTAEADFAKVWEAALEAETAGAEQYAAKLYEDAFKVFNAAREDSGNIKVRKRTAGNLDEAYDLFIKAAQAADQLKDDFPQLITAYEAAAKAESATLTEDLWAKAFDRFLKAQSYEADGESTKAIVSAIEAEDLFAQAELAALKHHYLDDVKHRYEVLIDRKMDKITPVLLEKANTAITEAEKQLEQDRYADQEIKRHADAAISYLNHAEYLASWIATLPEEDGRTEKLILQFEEQLAKISQSVSVEPNFDQNFSLTTEAILREIRKLQDDNRYLGQKLRQRDSEVGALEAELGKLESQSGKYISEIETNRQKLQRKERFETKIKEITSVLDPERGSVSYTISGENTEIVIRLTGLQFSSGSADLKQDDFTLLDECISIMQEFPKARIEVHGHTDSQGSSQLNQKLSQDRAEAVRNYLVTKLPGGASIKAIGFGEDQPVASNDTAAGRRQNRRIEIILKEIKI